MISEISRTSSLTGNPLVGEVRISTSIATFKVNNAKLCIQFVTLSINESITFLENKKKGFKRTIS